MGRRGFAAWAAVLLAVGCHPQEDAAKQERENIQGTWGLVTMVVDGEEVTDRVIKETYRLTFEGSRYAIRVEGRTQTRGGYAVHAAATPKAMDITPGEGPDEGKTYLGIYKEEGGVLTVCAQEGERPTRFFGKDMRTGLLLVLKRQLP